MHFSSNIFSLCIGYNKIKTVKKMDEKQFGLRLAKFREQKGVSARDMSLSLGQNPGYINNIESGKARPSLPGFYYICEYLNVSPADFFDFKSPNSQRIDALLLEIRQLDDHKLFLVTELVKELNKK